MATIPERMSPSKATVEDGLLPDGAPVLHGVRRRCSVCKDYILKLSKTHHEKKTIPRHEAGLVIERLNALVMKAQLVQAKGNETPGKERIMIHKKEWKEGKIVLYCKNRTTLDTVKTITLELTVRDNIFRAWEDGERADLSELTLKVPASMPGTDPQFEHLEEVLRDVALIEQWPRDSFSYVGKKSVGRNRIIRFTATKTLLRHINAQEEVGVVFLGCERLLIYENGNPYVTPPAKLQLNLKVRMERKRTISFING